MLGEGDGEVAVLLLVQGEDHEVLDSDFANGLELGRRNDGLFDPTIGRGEVLGQNVARPDKLGGVAGPRIGRSGKNVDQKGDGGRLQHLGLEE